MLQQNNGNIEKLPLPVSACLLIHSAQGVIDNGGYVHFFETDWPGKPPYSKFVEAYTEIGCGRYAEDLQRVSRTFPFEEPHLHISMRNDFINEHYDKDECEVPLWGDLLCGAGDVWEKLEKYAISHFGEFNKS